VADSALRARSDGVTSSPRYPPASMSRGTTAPLKAPTPRIRSRARAASAFSRGGRARSVPWGAPGWKSARVHAILLDRQTQLVDDFPPRATGGRCIRRRREPPDPGGRARCLSRMPGPRSSRQDSTAWWRISRRRSSSARPTRLASTSAPPSTGRPDASTSITDGWPREGPGAALFG
jgi:hypothetical protein